MGRPYGSRDQLLNLMSDGKPRSSRDMADQLSFTDRAAESVCYGCGGKSPGYGYGEEDKEKYHDVCLECYWELQETYARRWESDYGDDTTVENPYELMEQDRELRERLRSFSAGRNPDG